MDRYFAPRRNLKIFLVVLAAVGGAAASIALTVFGKLLAGAPPATLSNYLWNMGVFGTMAGLLSP